MGFFLGVAKNVGHEMTFVIQKADNQRVITRSANPRAVIPQSAIPFLTMERNTVVSPLDSTEDVEEPTEEELHALEQEGLESMLADTTDGEVYYDVGGIKNHRFSKNGKPELYVEWTTGPDMKEYTWEPVSLLRRDAPLLITVNLGVCGRTTITWHEGIPMVPDLPTEVPEARRLRCS